jgi:diguanylate cyclase (GGDEF)-like protein
MLDWSKLPDLVAVALLTAAFASVARRGETSVSRIWLTGWLLITLHFAAAMFDSANGILGIVADDVSLSALASAGILFMYASVPYRQEPSSKWMLASILAINVVYVCLLTAGPIAAWTLNTAAIAYGAVPLALTLYASRGLHHTLRWIVVSLYCLLSVYLLSVQNLSGSGSDLAVNGVLFAVYFGCCLHVWYSYRRATAGALITIAGFLTWGMVFVVAPCLETFAPNVHLESEVWNLPKYVVAVGMILLLLEDQLEHNKYLALHDELTGLPNRRLFLDRLGYALERARRTGTKTALLVVDLDQFKQVNDTLGHHAGDLLLQQVSMIFAGRVRSSDTVARTGGDEFSVILEDTSDGANARQVARALSEYLNEPMQVQGHSVLVGASIGVAVFPDDASDMETLRIAADLRMYDQKNSAKESINRSGPGRIAPHIRHGEIFTTDFRVTPERYTA